MKIGFSSSACPGADLPTMIEQARTLGYDSIELRAPAAGQDSAAWAALGDPAAAAKAAGEAGVELACLATDLSFHWPDRAKLDEQKGALRHTLELAAKLGCPFVAIKSGSVPPLRSREPVLQRIVENVREMAGHAAEHRVIILLENSGNLASSRDLWYLLDAVGHPSVRGCWDPCQAKAVGDPVGLAVPRIGRSLAVAHMLDAEFAENGQLLKFVAPGEGQADLARFLLLMQGIGRQTQLIVSWPESGSPPQDLLAKAVAWIKAQLAEIDQAPELSAYKGDKNAPRYPAAPAAPAAAS